MPLVTRPGQPDDVGELLAKLQAPLPDRLVADAPEGEHLLDHPKAQRKAKVQPNRVADQLRREAGVGVLGRACHASLIPAPRCSGNPPRRQLDDARTVSGLVVSATGRTSLSKAAVRPKEISEAQRV